MLKLWNFSATLGRPNSEEKERKRRLREAQLQSIQRVLTLDRKLITGPSWRPSSQQPQRAKTFRNTTASAASNADENGPLSTSITNDVRRQNNYNNLRFRSKSSHKLDEDSQFVSRLRFFDDRPVGPGSNPQTSPLTQAKRHSSAAFLMTPGDDEDSNPRQGPDLYGMRRRYTTAFDSEDTDFTASISGGGGGGRGTLGDRSGNMVTFDTTKSNSKMEQRLRFSDQADMSTTSGTNRSSYGGTSDDGFGDYRSDITYSFYQLVTAPSLFQLIGPLWPIFTSFVQKLHFSIWTFLVAILI